MSTPKFAPAEYQHGHFAFARRLEGPALYVPAPLARRLITGVAWTSAALACAFALLVAWGQS